ncbi:MAG: ATP-dependent DNA helicase RecG [Chloroflexaceae bacterium]|nr:ATP-dependent DNA helicase RecG [Chloroflexaceae bacterium]
MGSGPSATTRCLPPVRGWSFKWGGENSSRFSEVQDQGQDYIIRLGKTLAEEQRRGCDNCTVAGGLEQFLAAWQNGEAPGGVLKLPAVQHALNLLENYESQPPSIRRERVGSALETLRSLFRKPQPAGQRRQRPTAFHRFPPETAPDPASPASASLAPLPLDTPVSKLPGVGRNVALAFKRLGLHTAEHLLYHFPHRYDDYRSQKPIANLRPGDIETVTGTVCEVRTFPLKRQGSYGIEVLLDDGSSTLKVTFFGSHWLIKQFPIGRKLVVSGKVKAFRGMIQMSSPDWEPYTEDELLHTGRLVPVHPLTKGLHERNARLVIKQVIDQAAPFLEDYLPQTIRDRVEVLPLSEAIAQIHFPDSQEMLTRARRRLGFDEFLLIQLGVVQRKMLWQSELSYPLRLFEAVHHDLLAQLPFTLTGAQQRALTEIFADIQRSVPMARLLQGDVGSGKTIVAAAALLQAIANGLQGALMAPTEILAEQHYRGLRQLLGKVRVPRTRKEADGDGPDAEPHFTEERRKRLDEIKQLLGMTPEDDLGGEGVRVALLTGSLGKKNRRRVLEAIENGDVDLVVGTHALITEGVRYHDLGLVCVDEQHRFGVEQRERLKNKGFNPHMLVMTATPIPRTLTMTIYGDLDTSVLNELPPGRQAIRTVWIRRSERTKAYRHLRKEIEKGRQAFVICPLVEESEKVDLPSAEEMHANLQNDIFPDLRIGLIHGRMLPREKDETMRAFGAHQFDLLVATAVVEVGIDVPNATTMMIDGAERFGLAQLHQFRGRVGRGQHQSYCILVSDIENEVTTQRLEAMETIHDGFELAEIDLKLRGPGEFFGRRQSGTPDLKVAQLTDTRLIHTARLEAQKILTEDPQLERPDHALLRKKVQEVQERWKEVGGAS